MKHPLPLVWRMIPEKYYLQGTHCATCKTDYFPPRQICPACRRHSKLSPKRMPQRGRIFSFTQVYAAPSGFEYEAPYYLAIIELENKVRLLAQIVDSEESEIKIGAKVEMRFRSVGQDDEESIISYGYKFTVVN